MRRKVENYINRADIPEGQDLTAHDMQVLKRNYGEDITDLMYACFKFGYQVGVEQAEHE